MVSPELQSPYQEASQSHPLAPKEEEPQVGKESSTTIVETIVISSPEVPKPQPAPEVVVPVKKSKRGRPPLSSHSNQSFAPPPVKRRNLDTMVGSSLNFIPMRLEIHCVLESTSIF